MINMANDKFECDANWSILNEHSKSGVECEFYSLVLTAPVVNLIPARGVNNCVEKIMTNDKSEWMWRWELSIVSLVLTAPAVVL